MPTEGAAVLGGFQSHTLEAASVARRRRRAQGSAPLGPGRDGSIAWLRRAAPPLRCRDPTRGTMLTILVAGSIFFPGLFLLSKRCLKHAPGLRWSEGDTVIVSARLVSSIQAIMASTAGYIIATSCEDIIEDQHWLTSSYILFAVPYFVYDIYAMFMCYWYKLQVKGHEDKSNPRALSVAFTSYLRREFLMVLHHVVMVTVCFPVSVGGGQSSARYASIPLYMVPFSVPWQCNLGAALLMAPQVYWFSLICRGAFRLFAGSSRSRAAPPAVKAGPLR
ncbi:hypothetical protein Z043_113149 [Scleropages formosus]|uniref:TLC domain-containing protein n=1 Tax=Scleropages formosus TaxID=113540 RepID=A0A0P7U223_SCLFO|nr:hypothetical protein Z043_113149 [Scleropages formosus]